MLAVLSPTMRGSRCAGERSWRMVAISGTSEPTAVPSVTSMAIVNRMDGERVIPASVAGTKEKTPTNSRRRDTLPPSIPKPAAPSRPPTP